MPPTTTPTLWDSDPGDDTWSVAELSEALELHLRQAFPAELWLRGQIRNLKRSPRGTVWFDIVEPPPGPAQPAPASLSVVLFDKARRQVNARLRLAGGAVRMEDGTEVRIQGRVAWWAGGGRLQLTMSDIDPEFTLGRLLAERERIMRLLDTEGLLRAQARLPLAEVPRHVGLVTSADSAAEHDVLDELRRSGLGFRVSRVDSRVQGPDAPRQLVAALHRVAEMGVDVVLLVRGGGATTDLAAFDDESLARTIAGLDVPVMSGVGHEVDRSLTDEVAHSAHKTPTAAAQALIGHVQEFLARLDAVSVGLVAATRRRLEAADTHLSYRAAGLTRSATSALAWAEHRLDRDSGRVEAAARVHLASGDRHLSELADQLGRRAQQAVGAQERWVDAVAAQVRALDPARALARGWSITRTAAGATVRDPGQVGVGDLLVTTVAGGELRSTVTSAGATDAAPDPPTDPAARPDPEPGISPDDPHPDQEPQ